MIKPVCNFLFVVVQIPELITTVPTATVAPFHSNTVSSVKPNTVGTQGFSVAVATSNPLPSTSLQVGVMNYSRSFSSYANA